MNLKKRVLYLQYTNPAGYPPLEHSAAILREAGWEVLFLGIEAESHALEFRPDLGVKVRLLRRWPWRRGRGLHYLGFSLWVLGWALRWRSRWIYASDLPICPIALTLSFLPRFRLIYHEHDSPLSNDSVAPLPLSPLMRLILWSRRRLARRAEVCVLPNEKRADRLSTETGRSSAGRRTFVVWNCPTLDEVAPPRKPHPEGGLRLFYGGSIVPARLPATVLKAMARLPASVTLDIVGYETAGHRGYIHELQRQANQLGVSGRVRFWGTVPRLKQLLGLSKGCDVGVALTPRNSGDVNFQRMTGASNKPFEYLACGLALLVSDLPDWRETYVEPGYGLACDPEDPQSIAESLRRFLEHPAGMRAMGEGGRRRILEEWNYERQFEPVLKRLEEQGSREPSRQ